MPPRPPRPCKKPGCAAFTQNANGFCEAHQKHAAELERQRQKRGDERRESASKRGYGHYWQRVRTSFLRRNPLCHDCAGAGRVTVATHVHHLDEDPRNNMDHNLLALCFDCHEKRHGRKRAGDGERA